MISSLVGLVSIFATTFATPFLHAAEPLPAPLPVVFDTPTYLSSQLTANPFSTDPRVAAEITALGNPTGTPKIEASIIGPENCSALAGQTRAYTLLLKNTGTGDALLDSIQFQYAPSQKFLSASPSPRSPEQPGDGLTYVSWSATDLGISALAPGKSLEFQINLAVQSDEKLVTTTARIYYLDAVDENNTPGVYGLETLTGDACGYFTETPNPNQHRALMEVNIINPQPCLIKDEGLSYRVVIRNIGGQVGTVGPVVFTYGEGMRYLSADPAPALHRGPVGEAGQPATGLQDPVPTPSPEGITIPEDKFVLWELGKQLKPGESTEVNVVFEVEADVPGVGVTVGVQYTYEEVLPNGQKIPGTRVAGDGHGIRGRCDNKEVTGEALKTKTPAIKCGPGEKGCTETFTNLSLGKNYRDVLNQPDKGDATKPLTLGKRFEEVRADILPGECRVLPDDIITSPEFHDALNRRAKAAAPYLFPLYESGQEYRQLTHENELLGIVHLQVVRQALQEAHNTNWQEHLQLIQDIQEGRVSFLQTLARYDALATTWRGRIQVAQDKFLDDYKAMQAKRQEKFRPVAEQAVQNAIRSITRACGIPGDGGLAGRLPAVQVRYEKNLDARATAYPLAQKVSAAAYSELISLWRQKLAGVVATATTGSTDVLANHAAAVTRGGDEARQKVLQPYLDHDKQDEAADNTIRLQAWEVALDAPKTAATTCEKENVFAPPVEQTWCESTTERQVFLKEAPVPVRSVKPPLPIPGGERAVINPADVRGEACRGQAGDPWWNAQCSCHCGQQVVCGDQVTLCEACFPITRHDIHVDDQLECLNDVFKNHEPEKPEHFF